MTYTERRALAAARLAALAEGRNPYATQADQAEQAEPLNQRAADAAVDRGLTQWWA